MRRHGPLHGLKVVVIVIAAVTLISLGTMHLWNWLMPAVFGLRAITWAQALGLLVLSKILFGGLGRGGFGRGRYGGGGHRWKQEMRERWGEMSPEERERLRVGLKGRWGCWPGPGREDGSEGTPVE
jgi:hypothetical protein